LQIESLNLNLCRDHLKEEVLLMLFNHMMENMAWNDQHILGNVIKDSNLSDLPEDNLLEHDRNRNLAFEHHLSLSLVFHEEVGSFLQLHLGLGHAKTQL
jgi:hypothetical protein